MSVGVDCQGWGGHWTCAAKVTAHWSGQLQKSPWGCQRLPADLSPAAMHAIMSGYHALSARCCQVSMSSLLISAHRGSEPATTHLLLKGHLHRKTREAAFGFNRVGLVRDETVKNWHGE